MPISYQFTIPTLGMTSQSHALNTIGNNVANVTTGGYRRTDTQFSTLASRAYYEQSDIGGVKPKDFNRISVQGFMVASTSNFDVAINGKGYFVLNTDLEGAGDALYTRDGGFGMVTANPVTVPQPGGETLTTYEGYLVDKNNYYVQGYPWDITAGDFSTTLGSIRIDENIYADTGVATTAADVSLNLPSNAAVIGDHAAAVTAALAGATIPGLQIYNMDVVDSDFEHQSVAVYFSKQSPNNWSMSYVTDTLIPSAPPTAMTFDANGQLTAPAAPVSMALTFASAATATVAMDFSSVVQFAGDFTPFSYNQNGYAAALMSSFNFEPDGQITGTFVDGTFRPVYKLPLAEFANPDLMDVLNGNTYRETSESGTVTLVNPGSGGYALLAPNTHELSNVDIADEFTKMIMTQSAYNASATVFRTVDEMTQEASRLKR